MLEYITLGDVGAGGVGVSRRGAHARGAGARTPAVTAPGARRHSHSAGKPTPSHTRAHRSPRSNAGPSRPGALLGASIPTTLHSTCGAKRHGRRRSHTGLADQRYTFCYLFRMTCPPWTLFICLQCHSKSLRVAATGLSPELGLLHYDKGTSYKSFVSLCQLTYG